MNQETHYARFMEENIRGELEATPAVVLAGPRQSGKTTLVRKFIKEGFEYFTLNDETTMLAIKEDLRGFLLSHEKNIQGCHGVRFDHLSWPPHCCE